MDLTEAQVLELAPDEGSRKSGRGLAAPSKWVSRGLSARAVWGECQGSGSKPYQTMADTGSLAFKCSCPSRKFPCKHGIGLLLFYVRNRDEFSMQEEPSWVGGWINKRSEKEETKAARAEKPVDEAAQAKRLQAREEQVSEGMEALLLWMKDILRHGILLLPEKEPSFFDGMARRLVDAKAPGLAGMVKELGAINFYDSGWQTAFMDGMARLYLFIAGFKNIGGLNEDLQQDIRSGIGFTRQQESLREEPGITDTWLVLGRQVINQEQLTIERYWLYGAASRQYALILQFLVAGQPAQLLLTSGSFIRAEIVYYPSAAPLRAVIRQQAVTPEQPACAAFSGWSEVAEAEAAWNSRLPFRGERPYIVAGLRPVQHEDSWWLQDGEGGLMSVPEGCAGIWKLLSLGGGDYLKTAVMGGEQQYLPLGVWQGDNYLTL